MADRGVDVDGAAGRRLRAFIAQLHAGETDGGHVMLIGGVSRESMPPESRLLALVAIAITDAGERR